MKVLKFILEVIVLVVVGGGIVFMMLWALASTDSQYMHPPSYVTQDDFLFSEAGREGWTAVTNRED